MIKYIQLFGERCSGTNFLASLIKKNFVDVEITTGFGGKHWFIKDHDPRGIANQSTDYECRRRLTENEDTLFICLFRDPFDWVRSINVKPYHARHHRNLPLTEFLQKPWRSFETSRVNLYWPDRQDQYWFIEEAENILRLRSQKIAHLLNLQSRVKHIYFLTYEKLRDNNNLLYTIAEQFDIKLTHSYILGEQEHFGRHENKKFTKPQYPEIPQEAIEFIRGELDWELENRIGYKISQYKN